jgi:uncharacterized membrane protein
VKDNGQVWLTAGKMPLLVGGTYGKGRVVACAGTVLGEPEPGKIGFWESPAWTEAAAGVLTWLMQIPERAEARQ